MAPLAGLEPAVIWRAKSDGADLRRARWRAKELEQKGLVAEQKPGNRRNGESETGVRKLGEGESLHATTDQRRKAPRAIARADHDRTKMGDCRDHQDKMDSKRETPSNGSTRADNTDRTARTWSTTGVRDVGPTIHSATPNTNRPIEAVQRPALDRQRSTKAAILVGETRPKTPIPTTKIETTATITATAPVSAYVSTRGIGGSPPRTLDGI